jgi:predicted GIY-YIG superfamily endonuclease
MVPSVAFSEGGPASHKVPSYGWQAIQLIFTLNSLINKPMFYAYVLQSINFPNEFYRDHSTNLKQRVTEHNTGNCPHTAKYKPWRVKFYAAFETLELAQAFERYLKSGSGHSFAKRHLGL